MSNPYERLKYFSEDPIEFLYETSSIAQNIGERDCLLDWYKSVFIPAVRVSVEQSLAKYFAGDIENALEALEKDTSNQLWRVLNDDLREAILKVPRVNLVLGKEHVEAAFVHDEKEPLNTLVKSYVNACLLLIQKESKRSESIEGKEPMELPFDVDEILPQGTLMTQNDLIKKLVYIGFEQVNASNHIHLKFYKGSVFLGKLTFSYGGKNSQATMPKKTVSAKRMQLKAIAQKAIE